jgi:hypothetical protein
MQSEPSASRLKLLDAPEPLYLRRQFTLAAHSQVHAHAGSTPTFACETAVYVACEPNQSFRLATYEMSSLTGCTCNRHTAHHVTAAVVSKTTCGKLTTITYLSADSKSSSGLKNQVLLKGRHG